MMSGNRSSLDLFGRFSNGGDTKKGHNLFHNQMNLFAIFVILLDRLPSFLHPHECSKHVGHGFLGRVHLTDGLPRCEFQRNDPRPFFDLIQAHFGRLDGTGTIVVKNGLIESHVHVSLQGLAWQTVDARQDEFLKIVQRLCSELERVERSTLVTAVANIVSQHILKQATVRFLFGCRRPESVIENVVHGGGGLLWKADECNEWV